MCAVGVVELALMVVLKPSYNARGSTHTVGLGPILAFRSSTKVQNGFIHGRGRRRQVCD